MPEPKDIIGPKTLKTLDAICNIDSRTALSPDGATQVARIVGRELESLGFACEESPCDTTPSSGLTMFPSDMMNPQAACTPQASRT